MIHVPNVKRCDCLREVVDEGWYPARNRRLGQTDELMKNRRHCSTRGVEV